MTWSNARKSFDFIKNFQGSSSLKMDEAHDVSYRAECAAVCKRSITHIIIKIPECRPGCE